MTTSHLENERQTSFQSQTAFGSENTPRDLTEGIQRTFILKRHRETGDPCAQYTEKVIQIRVTEFIVSGPVKKLGHTNPNELKSEFSAKSKSDCRPISCKLLEEILLPSSQTSDSTVTILQHSQARSSPEMLTSSVVTALAPNWSTRYKKQKQGVADVSLNATEQELQKKRQEVHPPSAFLRRDVPQQPFSGDPKPLIGDVFPEVSNKENALSMTSSRSSTDSRSGSNLFNLRNHGPAKRRLSKTFSTGMSGGKTDRKTDVVHPPTSPMDTVMRPVSPHSLDLRWSRSISQTGQFSCLNSTPTTGSMLLSLRKMNLSSKSAGTPSEVHPISPTNSQNEKVFRMSEPLSYATLQRNRAKSHLNPSQPLSNSIDKAKGASEIFHFSTSAENRQHESFRPCMSVYSNNNTEIIKSPNITSSTDSGPPLTSPRYSNLNVTKNDLLCTAPGSMLRRQHTIQKDSLLQGTPSRTSAVRRTVSNVSDLLNNNKVGTMLTSDSMGTTSPTYSSSIYSGIPKGYDRLTSSNLNTLTNHTDANILRSAQSVTNFNSYSRSNNNGTQQAKSVDIPRLSRWSNTPSTFISSQINSPVSPREEYALHQPANLTSPLASRNARNKTTLEQQSSLNASRPLSIRETNITDITLCSPDKNCTPVERAATSPLWQRNVEDLAPTRKQSQSPAEPPDPLSPSIPMRGIRAPTTFSSLRLGSPTSPTSPTPPSSMLLSQRRETRVSSPPQEKNEQLRKGSEYSYGHTSSPVSQFNFDLSTQARQRSISKTDSTGTSVPLGSSHSSEKNKRSSMSPSPYVNLLSTRQKPSSASSPPIPQSQQSSGSFDSTVNTSDTLKAGRTTMSARRSPYLVVKLSEEQLNAVDKQPLQVMQQLGTSEPLLTQGTVRPCTNQPASTTSKYISDAKGIESTSPRLTFTFETQTHKQDEKMSVFRSDSISKLSPVPTEKHSLQLNQPISISQKEDKRKNKDITDSQNQKWSLFSSRNQRDSSSREKENRPLTQSFEKTKNIFAGSRMEHMLDRLKQSFSVKHREEEAGVKTEDTSLHQRSSRSSVPGSQGKLESWRQSADREAPFHSVSKNTVGPGLFIQDQISTKPLKRNESDESLFKVPRAMVGEHKTKPQQIHRSSHVNQYATLPANWKTSKGSSNLSSLMDFYAEDVESERHFSCRSQPRRKTTSLCESKDDDHLSEALDQEVLQPSRGQLSSCSDIKYRLSPKRSFSVFSVQSSRPSGTGRISRSSSRASSISDLTSAADLMTLDDIVTQETIVNPDDPHSGGYRALQIGQRNVSPDQVWSSASLDRTSCPWENELDPTPPPSPTFSPTTRRLSRAPGSSSQGSQTSQGSLSPRGHLPSRSYTCNLSVFEESSSDSTTTDDEYYLDDDENGKETEL